MVQKLNSFSEYYQMKKVANHWPTPTASGFIGFQLSKTLCEYSKVQNQAFLHSRRPLKKHSLLISNL